MMNVLDWRLEDAHRIEAEFKDMLARTYGMVPSQINERS
jgi:hypothetical protein